MDLSFYTNFSNSLAQQETLLNSLQQQISTGLAVQTPDQNPAAYEQAALGNDQISALSNDNTTQAAIQVQLGSVNDAYQATTGLLDSVQTVLESALNGTTSASNMNALATQVQAASKQLLGIGNTTSANGTYLFGGSRGSLAPFQTNDSGSVVYMGDGAQSQAAITPNTSASTIANGDVFTSGLSGDGVSEVTAAAANTGSGQLLSQGVTSASTAAAFQAGTAAITLSISVSGGVTSYTATQGGTVLSTGTVNGDTNVQLAGVDYEITGAPADGDSFTIAPSRPQSVFALLQNIYTALSTAGSTAAQVAQTNQVLNQSLAGVAQYQQAVITAQAQNGVTLQAISSAATGNTNQSTQVQTNVTNAVGVNTPVAIASLDQTLTALQSAMKTFGDVQSLSLFSYL
jgi:flagellar hook-associated protein 3 FlgL